MKRRQPARFIVRWDSGEELPFSPETVLRYQFAVEKEFSEEEFAVLCREDAIRRAKDQILKYLSIRPHSRKELLLKTLRKGYAAEEIEAALDDLEKVGLINDREFAGQFIRNEMLLRPCGTRLLKEKLLTKGVNREIVESLLSELCPPETQEAAIRHLTRKFWKANRRNDPKKRMERLIRHLQGKGFGWDLIQWVIEAEGLKKEIE